MAIVGIATCKANTMNTDEDYKDEKNNGWCRGWCCTFM